MRKFKYKGKMPIPVHVPGIGEFDKDYRPVTDEQAKALEHNPDYIEYKYVKPKPKKPASKKEVKE